MLPEEFSERVLPSFSAEMDKEEEEVSRVCGAESNEQFVAAAAAAKEVRVTLGLDGFPWRPLVVGMESPKGLEGAEGSETFNVNFVRLAVTGAILGSVGFRKAVDAGGFGMGASARKGSKRA
jgi:hypothetical protein